MAWVLASLKKLAIEEEDSSLGHHPANMSFRQVKRFANALLEYYFARETWVHYYYARPHWPR